MTAGWSRPKRMEAWFAGRDERVCVDARVNIGDQDARTRRGPPMEERAGKKKCSRAENRAGAKAHVVLEALSARLKSCPFAIGHSSFRAPGPGVAVVPGVAGGGTAGFVSTGCVGGNTTGAGL